MPTSTPGEEPEPHSARPGGAARRAGHDPAAELESAARGLRLPPALLALTVVSGIIDAVSFLALGHVFTANMTGNVAVLGFAAAGSAEFSAPRVLVSLGAFLLGSFAGGWAGHRFDVRAPTASAAQQETARRTWLRRAFAAEAALIGTAALLAGVGPGDTGTTRYTLIAVTALGMGVRNATVRRLGLADLTTTVLTAALTRLAAESPLVGGRGVGTGRRLGSVLSLLGGAVLGGWLVLHHDLWLPLLIAAVMTALVAAWVSGRE